MKIRYFEDTDTLLIKLKLGSAAQGPRGAPSLPLHDLDEDTLLTLASAQGQILGITLEHATSRAELSSFSFDRAAA